MREEGALSTAGRSWEGCQVRSEQSPRGGVRGTALHGGCWTRAGRAAKGWGLRLQRQLRARCGNPSCLLKRERASNRRATPVRPGPRARKTHLSRRRKFQGEARGAATVMAWATFTWCRAPGARLSPSHPPRGHLLRPRSGASADSPLLPRGTRRRWRGSRCQGQKDK